MSSYDMLLVAILAAGAWHVAAGVLIYEQLRRRGRNPSILLLRMYMPVYAGQYRRLTKAESGRTGPLFWHWVVSINLALVAFITYLLAASQAGAIY